MNIKRRFTRIKDHFTLQEVSGSLGDLGTYLPILISLTVGGQINLTSTLWFSGIFNILSGFYFQACVPTQPMKSIAASVLAANMSIQENMAAGIGVGAVLFFLGASRTINLVGNYTPIAVIRGIQLGTGFSLINTAFKMVKNLSWNMISETNANQWADNNVWLLLGFIFVFSCYHTKIPSALILFLIGIMFAFIQLYYPHAPANSPGRPVIGGYYPDTIIRPTPSEFRDGFVNAGLGQIPLSVLNSVIGLCSLIDDLFPDKHTNNNEVSMSVGVMNLIQCFFGAMPLCHGAGGLAGQYRFGARSETSVIMLGTAKLILGILFGKSLVGIFSLFPKSILAIMLFVSSIELASAAKAVTAGETDENKKTEKWIIMLVTAAVISIYNTGIGFLAGLVAAVLLSMQRLGLKNWFASFIESIKLIPKHWVADRDYSTGKIALPITNESSSSSLPSSLPSSSLPLQSNDNHNNNNNVNKNTIQSVDHVEQASSLPHKSTINPPHTE
ncbi:unnamed protein product [Cunninghamella blakesleeana]